MKYITTLIAAIVAITSTAHANLGMTLKEAKALYGKPIKTGPAWCGGTAYGFSYGLLYAYAIIPQGSNIIEDITYVYGNVKNQNLSAELIDDLETANLPARKYLKVISGRNLGGLGYQFRTEAQYKLEEQVRAKLTKQWLEQHKTSKRVH
jgi:hypothetical protein